MMREYSHAIPIEHGLAPGPLWDYKHNLEELEELEKADGYYYAAQYDQDPHKKGGSIFLTEWWQYYFVPPDYNYKAIFADTALKDGQQNDYTVFQCWAKWRGRIYLIDQYRGRIKATELKQKLTDFWIKHKGTSLQPCRAVYVEDKASGIQLIQDIQKDGGMPIIAIPRLKSKVERANNLCNWIKSGLLYLPQDVDWIYDYKTEFEKFSPLMTHAHDDQVDPTLDAIEHMLIADQPTKPKDNTNAQKQTRAPSRNAKIW